MANIYRPWKIGRDMDFKQSLQENVLDHGNDSVSHVSFSQRI